MDSQNIVRSVMVLCVPYYGDTLQIYGGDVGKAGRMKIKVIETVTEIEATAQEINASQTVGGRFASLLANALTPYRAYDEDDADNDAERRTDDEG